MSKFEIFKGKDDQFYFRLKAGNGQNILRSEGYSSKSACENGISSVKTNSIENNRFEKKQGDSGKFMFNLKAGNGQVVGTSESYDSEAGCDNGIKSVITNATNAEIDDLSEA